jgi:hypothetical protein
MFARMAYFVANDDLDETFWVSVILMLRENA